MSPDIKSFLDCFNQFDFLILYTLAGYLLAAPASLALWLATQKAPSIPAPKDESVSWKKKAHTSCIVLSALAIELVLVTYASQEVLHGIFLAIFGIMFYSGTLSLLFNVSGILRWKVHRNNRGVPLLRAVREKRNKKQKAVLVSTLMASVAITAGAFVTSHPALIAVTSAGVIFNMSRRAGFKSISMRWMIIGLLLWTVSSLLICAALVFAILARNSSEPVILKSNSGVLEWVDWSRSSSWVLVPIYAFFPGVFISLCLRFDYQRYLDNNQPTPEFILSTVPAPHIKRKGFPLLGEGVVLPSRAPTAFPKVYYATALVAWGLAQLGVICINVFTELSLDTSYEYCVIVLLVELPIMCLALIAVAAVRGEWKALWSYREVWTVRSVAKETPASEPDLLVLEDEEKVEHVTPL